MLNLFTFLGINETINNNQEDSKQRICFKYYPFNYKNIAYKKSQPEACFGKALRLDESRLPSSCIDTSCLKNVQK